MNSTNFADYLNQHKYGPAVVLQAALLYVGERSGYKAPQQMRAEVEKLVGDSHSVGAALAELQTDHRSAEQVFLDYLTDEWSSPNNQDAIQRAFQSAERRLPVIETAIVAAVALYAMYLLTYQLYLEKTGAVATRRTVKRLPDGTVEETNVVEPVSPPATPDAALGQLISLILKALKSAGTG